MAELATIDQVRTALGIVDNASDATVSQKLDAAEAMIRDYCARPLGFVSQSITESFDGENTQQLVLRYTPVTTVTSVTADGAAVSAEYEVNASGILSFKYVSFGPSLGRNTSSQTVTGVPYRSPSFGNSINQVDVVYTGGYSAASIPANLTECAIQLAAMLFRDSQRDKSVQSESLGDYSYTLAGSPNKYVRIMDDLIFNYQRGALL